MAKSFHIDVVSAEEEIFSGSAQFVTLPGAAGELGIYAGHTPLITRIKPGAVQITPEQGEEVVIFVQGGLLEVQPGQVSVLADTAIRGVDLDEARALDAKKHAEDALNNRNSDFDLASAQAELAVASAQLATLAKFKRRR